MHKKCLYDTNMRIYLKSGRTTETLRKPYKGLCIKNRQAPMGCYEDMERFVFMSATEAQAHGIVDLVVVK
ncbi:hypothetical protein CXB51_026046 [Gossypium anomalum]|uniref:ATP-dependent Clp protease proteolytic subunit n=1 Tax=Gossypium anomalum TaxID=47600 RepID=A0A8J5Y2I2_9ROSI|nr:hypothetical protein CXB51_026046 [Gossypium anomalum]